MHISHAQEHLNSDTLEYVKRLIVQDMNLHICLCMRHIVNIVSNDKTSFEDIYDFEKILEHMMNVSKNIDLRLSDCSCRLICYACCMLRCTCRKKYMCHFTYWQVMQSISAYEQKLNNLVEMNREKLSCTEK